MNCVFPCFIMVLLVVAQLVPAAVSDSGKQFDVLFGERVRQVKATSSSVDDVNLAKELLQIASTTTSNKEMLAVLCDQVYELAMRSSNGYQVAAEAMAFLALHAPDRQADAKQRQLNAMIKIAVSGPSDQRAAAGQQVVTAMIELGDLHLSKGEVPEALSQYQRARTMAIRFDRGRISETVARMKQARERVALLKEIESLEEKVLQNAKDNASIERLVVLYIAELNRPDRAVAYAGRVQDATLKTVCQFAKKWPSELDAATSLTMGEWFFGQSSKGEGNTKAWLLDRSKAHLDRFVFLHSKQDLQRGKASLLLSQVKAMRQKIDVPTFTFAGPATTQTPDSSGNDGPTTPQPAPSFTFDPTGVELLRSVTKPGQLMGGQWKRTSAGLYLPESEKEGRIDFPVYPNGNFTVWVDLTRHTGGDGVNGAWLVRLPIGDRHVATRARLKGTSLEYVAGRPYWKFPGRVGHSFENGRLQMRIDVKVNKDQVTIDATVSKDHKVSWQGPISDISAGRWARRDKKNSFGFIASKNQSFTIHSIKVKMHSGSLKMVN